MLILRITFYQKQNWRKTWTRNVDNIIINNSPSNIKWNYASFGSYSQKHPQCRRHFDILTRNSKHEWYSLCTYGLVCCWDEDLTTDDHCDVIAGLLECLDRVVVVSLRETGAVDRHELIADHHARPACGAVIRHTRNKDTLKEMMSIMIMIIITIITIIIIIKIMTILVMKIIILINIIVITIANNS